MAGEQRQGWKQQSSGRINNAREALLCLQPRPGLTHSYVSFSFVTLPFPLQTTSNQKYLQTLQSTRKRWIWRGEWL